MRQIVWITGGNDGIGLATAQVLLERGMFVLISGRNVTKLKAAVATLKHRTKKNTIDWLLCDMANHDSIREAVKVFQDCYDQLDILINNAGVFSSDLALSKDGVEIQFATNYLGHFLLTDLLLPHLSLSPISRIINVASVVHYKGVIDYDNLRGEKGNEHYDGMKAYAQSKLANVLFTRELARRYPDITSNCLHPGTVRTRIGDKGANCFYAMLWILSKPFMRPTRCGARTSVYLALSPEVKGVKGRYFDQNQACRKPSSIACGEAAAKKLWEWSEAAVKK